MEIQKEVKKDAYAARLSISENGAEVGRAWLYILFNNLHQEPFALLEDVFVDDKFRERGYGRLLVERAVEEAKKIGCYKLIFTARHAKPDVQAWYKKMGFNEWGAEFRMDFR